MIDEIKPSPEIRPPESSADIPVLPTSKPETHRKIFKYFIFILIILFMLMLFPLPYYESKQFTCPFGPGPCPTPGWRFNPPLIQSILMSNTKQNSSKIITPTPSPTLSIEADIFAGWKTYTNTLFQYSVRYPSDWKANSIGPGIGTIPPDDAQRGLLLIPPTAVPTSGMGIPIEDIHIQIEADSTQTSGMTYEAWVNDAKSNATSSTISVSETDFASTKTIVIQKEFSLVYLLASPDKSIYYFIEIKSPTPDYRNTLNQILSTFKFIEPTTTVTNGTVTGKVCYPSEGIPDGIIRAKNVESQVIYSQNHPQNTGSFTMDLKSGTYKMRFEPGGTDAYPGYHTGCSGVEQYCNETEKRSSIQISVIPGNTTKDVKLCDFYYPSSSQPDF